MNAPRLSRTWIRTPVAVDPAGDVRPKYAIESDAFVLYRDDSAYVSFADESAGGLLAHYPDVRVLDPAEGRAFEQGLRFEFPPPDRRAVGLGDVVAALGRTIGFRECGGCRKRKAWLNKIRIWGWRSSA